MAAIESDMPPLHAADTLSASGGSASAGGNAIGNTINASNNNTTSSTSTNSSSSASNSGSGGGAVNNTICAAADSSDNQPATPQPQQQQQQQQNSVNEQQTAVGHHPYATHHIYAAGSTHTSSNSSSGTGGVPLPHVFASGIYSISPQDMQQQSQNQQQQQQQQVVGYPSYLNSYEQFYQQQSQPQLPSASGGSAASLDFMYGPTASEYKSSASLRYHPYLQTPTSALSAGGDNNGLDTHENVSVSNSNMSLPNSSAAVSTTTSMSPRIVSSSSPTSTSNSLQLSSGNPSSPGCKLQCKKCGIMCTNESELQEHITNVHGASPYGSSSGYSSSPYIKEEPQGPPTTVTQQQTGGNPGEILDLDSQKMVYPPLPGSLQAPMLHQQPLHDVVGGNDPLHSMHSMQQRALPGWEQQSSAVEGLPAYMQQSQQQQQQDVKSAYYSPKQLSPYHVSGGLKQEYPIIKSEYADSQNYVDKSFDPTASGDMCAQSIASQQTQQMMPVSSSPAEFPSTTTGPQEQQQQYRGFEPPTSSSVLPANSITAKAASWKSNEARRPKTYNCTACNKWFTSSGHLKRHYNTTLHKNAVKSSGQPDPATLPISVHHHPARDPSGKHSRRSNASAAVAAAQQQQQAPAPVQPPEPPRSPPDYASQTTNLAQMSHYATSPSPTLQQQTNGMNSYASAQQNGGYQYMSAGTTNASPQHNNSTQQQTVLNGHPNGLAGPSAPTTAAVTTTLPPSSHTRGLLNTTTTIITKSEIMEDTHHSPMDMEMQMQQRQQHQLEEEETLLAQQQQRLSHHRQLELEEEELDYNGEMQRTQLQLYQPLDLQRLYHNNTPNSMPSNNMRAQSPLTISQQHYREQLLQQRHQMADNIYTHKAHMPPHSIMEALQPPPYNIIPLATNMPQHSSSMQLLQQQPHIITTSTATTSMDSMQPTTLHNPQQQPPQQLLPHQQLQRQLPLADRYNTSSTNIQSHSSTIIRTQQQQQHTIITHTPPQPQHTPQQQPHTTSTIPSFQQLQQQASELAPQLEHTMTFHTIIGSNASNISSELLNLTTYDGYGHLQQQQVITTPDGQILQLIPTTQLLGGQTLYTSIPETYAPVSPYIAQQRSPQEGDLPPMQTFSSGVGAQESSQTVTVLPSLAYSPTISSSTLTTLDANGKEVLESVTRDSSVTNKKSCNLSNHGSSSGTTTTTTLSRKRKRVPSAGSTSPTTTTLSTGRIKCLECNKEFTKNCYLTQHNKSFHFGEYPYRCIKCGKRYQSEDVYTTHLSRHKSEDKPHKCDLCPKQFHHKTDLRRHVQAIHTGVKQHECEECGKAFCRQDHLRKHIETHRKPKIMPKKLIKSSGNSSTNALAESNEAVKLLASVLSSNATTSSPNGVIVDDAVDHEVETLLSDEGHKGVLRNVVASTVVAQRQPQQLQRQEQSVDEDELVLPHDAMNGDYSSIDERQVVLY